MPKLQSVMVMSFIGRLRRRWSALWFPPGPLPKSKQPIPPTVPHHPPAMPAPRHDVSLDVSLDGLSLFAEARLAPPQCQSQYQPQYQPDCLVSHHGPDLMSWNPPLGESLELLETELTPEFQDMITTLFLQKLSEACDYRPGEQRTGEQGANDSRTVGQMKADRRVRDRRQMHRVNFDFVGLPELVAIKNNQDSTPCYLDLEGSLPDDRVRSASQYFYQELRATLQTQSHNN